MNLRDLLNIQPKYQEYTFSSTWKCLQHRKKCWNRSINKYRKNEIIPCIRPNHYAINLTANKTLLNV